MNAWLVATSAFAAVAAALAVGGSGAGVLRRRLPGPTGRRGPAASIGAVRSWPGPGWRFRGDIVGLLAGLLIVAVFGVDLVLLAGTAALMAVVAVRVVAGRRRRVQALAHRRQVVEICDALGAELRAGQPAVHALRRVAAEHPLLGRAAHAAALGSDLPAALGSLAARPGADGLRMVAAAWWVADRAGAGPALVLDRIATVLRGEQAASAELAASLGPARATAQMLAVLPLLGLLLGIGIGGDPVGFLLQTPVGNLCLAAGGCLAAVGVWWVERLAAAVERR